MAAILLSNLTGLARIILMGRVFGTSAEMDAFTPANRVAETLFTLVAGGALGSAFIPTFTGLLTQGRTKRAWELASSVANLILIVLTFASALAAVFAPQIVRYLLVPGFDPYRQQLTINLLRIMLPTAVIFGLSGLVMGILNSQQVFLVPALTPSLFNLGQIFGMLVLAPYWGIYGLAAGVLIGTALHLGVQLPTLLRHRGPFFPILGLNLPEVREVGRLMGPRVFGVAVVQLNFWVNNFLASRMAYGSLAAIGYAFPLMLMPLNIIASSVATAALPTFSAQYAQGKLDELREALAASLRGVLLLSIPATFGLILLRRPLLLLLFDLDPASTDLVSWALLWYTVGLVGHSGVEILARSFFALHDTRTPVIMTSIAMGLNVLFSLLFSALFARLGWMPHGGLALANSLATGLEMAGLLWLMRRRLDGLNGRQVLVGVAKGLLAALVMAGGLWLWLRIVEGQPAWLITLGGALLGGLVYGIAILALRVEELYSLLSFGMAKLGLKK